MSPIVADARDGGRQVCVMMVAGERNAGEPGAFERQGGGAGVQNKPFVSMEHFWALLFQLMKHGNNPSHVVFIFLFSLVNQVHVMSNLVWDIGFSTEG